MWKAPEYLATAWRVSTRRALAAPNPNILPRLVGAFSPCSDDGRIAMSETKAREPLFPLPDDLPEDNLPGPIPLTPEQIADQAEADVHAAYSSE
jgi:hypothetical protein